MGSKSDFPVMKEAADVLGELGVGYEIMVVSAHRTPRRMYDFAEAAAGRGIKVIIAGAGGAAHLPGMVAAMTALPVIGVPIISKALGGLDSLYSIAQMPPGIPVAAMAIGGAKNAGILAARIIGAYDEGISENIRKYMKKMEEDAAASSLEVEVYK